MRSLSLTVVALAALQDGVVNAEHLWAAPSAPRRRDQEEPSFPPNPGFPPCDICGEGLSISNPGGSVQFPTQPVFTCEETAEAGLIGLIDPIFCSPALLSSFLQECNCAPSTPAPVETTAPISKAPVTAAPIPLTTVPTPAPIVTETPAPTPAPTTATTAPGTPAPTTVAPGTAAPITVAPTTAPVAPVTPAPVTPAPSTSMPVMPDTPGPSNGCGLGNELCADESECCSSVCQRKPGESMGLCLSSKTVSKNTYKLSNGLGGAGGTQAKALLQ